MIAVTNSKSEDTPIGWLASITVGNEESSYKNKETPVFNLWCVGQGVKTLLFHGSNTGSIPVRTTKQMIVLSSIKSDTSFFDYRFYPLGEIMHFEF